MSDRAIGSVAGVVAATLLLAACGSGDQATRSVTSTIVSVSTAPRPTTTEAATVTEAAVVTETEVSPRIRRALNRPRKPLIRPARSGARPIPRRPRRSADLQPQRLRTQRRPRLPRPYISPPPPLRHPRPRRGLRTPRRPWQPWTRCRRCRSRVERQRPGIPGRSSAPHGPTTWPSMVDTTAATPATTSCAAT